MTKITVTYKAPPGETKMTAYAGTTFYDGKPEEIEVDEATEKKIRANPMFTVGGDAPKAPPKDDPPDAKHKGK